MYKSNVFNTFYDLTEFLNSNNILPSEIISITPYFNRGVALVYLDKESGKEMRDILLDKERD